MMKFHCALGDKVSLVPHHWLRPYESGIVVDQQRQALKKWLVQFPDVYPGGGIGGDKIWCDESDFAEVTPGAAKNPTWSVPSEEVPLDDGRIFSGISENGDAQLSNRSSLPS
jgi:hypothetical protein